MKIEIVCSDKNEATKLASLIFIKDGKETFISSILNMFDNEVVLGLKDHSAHSVLLRDSKQVERFADFIQSVLDNVNKIVDTKATNEIVEIVKD